jgi:DNA-binding response OmpR family regulator
MRALTSFYADLVVWDSSVSDTTFDGFCRWLLANPTYRDIPLLFITTPGRSGLAASLGRRRRNASSVRHAILRKPFQWEQLATTIQRLISDGGQSASVVKVGDLGLDSQNHTLILRGRKLLLTPTEFRLVYYLAQSEGKVVSVDELLEHVWGFYPGTGSRELVRQHVSNLRRKLSELEDGRDLIATLPRRGYQLVPPR